MTDARTRQQIDHAVEHAIAGAQDGHQAELLAAYDRGIKR